MWQGPLKTVKLRTNVPEILKNKKNTENFITI